MVPLSAEVYFASLADFNSSMWPRQIAAILLALAATALTFWPQSWSARAIGAILALAWLHTALTYHLGYFADLNFWDYPAGLLFLTQAALVAWFAIVRNGLQSFDRSGLAIALMLFAAIGLPLIGLILGRPTSELAILGMAPTPTLLFSAGALLGAPWFLWLLPLTLILPGLVLALDLPIPEDFCLLVLPVLFAYRFFQRSQRANRQQES